MRKSLKVFILALVVCFFATALVFAAPLSVTISPASTVNLNSNFQVQATGGTGPYWISFSDYSLLIYTPSKLDSKGRPNGLWSMQAIKVGQCTITMRDSTGATASATLTVKAPTQAPPPLPLKASLSNLSPYIQEDTILAVSGGTPPYKVTASSSSISITAINAEQWKIRPSQPSSFALQISDNNFQSTSISGTAKDRIPDLNVFFQGGKSVIYTQWPNLNQQQVIHTQKLALQIAGGKGPWSVTTDPRLLTVSIPLGNVATAPYYQLAWTGTPFSSVDVVVRDSRGYVKVVKVTSPPQLLLDYWPKNRTIKTNETFLIMVRGGAAPFSIDWDQNTPLSGYLKNMQHSDPAVLQVWGISGLKPGHYRFTIRDETAKTTRFMGLIGLTVTP